VHCAQGRPGAGVRGGATVTYLSDDLETAFGLLLSPEQEDVLMFALAVWGSSPAHFLFLCRNHAQFSPARFSAMLAGVGCTWPEPPTEETT
jgi:hypothetical protein